MSDQQDIDVVWFKRDLRLHDHLPLKQAIESPRPVLLCYMYEPSLFESGHYDLRHGRFIWESLQDMQDQLEEYKTRIHVFHNEVIPVFKKLSTMYHIHTVYSHEETGVNLTFERDKKVARYFEDNNICWKNRRPMPCSAG